MKCFVFILLPLSLAMGFDELTKSMEKGKKLYVSNCLSCHLEQGQGIATLYPPLAKSDYMQRELKDKIEVILKGAEGEMVVNGVTYNGTMSGYQFTDEELADLLNYIGNSWGNKAKIVTAKEINEYKSK